MHNHRIHAIHIVNVQLSFKNYLISAAYTKKKQNVLKNVMVYIVVEKQL